MLFGETVAVYCENHTEHTATLCGQNAEFWCVKASGTYRLGFKGLILPTVYLSTSYDSQNDYNFPTPLTNWSL
jgi:hypothetical protein